MTLWGTRDLRRSPSAEGPSTCVHVCVCMCAHVCRGCPCVQLHAHAGTRCEAPTRRHSITQGHTPGQALAPAVSALRPRALFSFFSESHNLKRKDPFFPSGELAEERKGKTEPEDGLNIRDTRSLTPRGPGNAGGAPGCPSSPQTPASTEHAFLTGERLQDLKKEGRTQCLDCCCCFFIASTLRPGKCWPDSTSENEPELSRGARLPCAPVSGMSRIWPGLLVPTPNPPLSASPRQVASAHRALGARSSSQP